MSLKLRFLVNGVDRSSLVPERQWSVSLNEGTIIDTMSLTLSDEDLSLTVVEGQEVIVEDFNDNTFRLFAGIISDVSITPEGLGRVYKLTVQDWKILLERTSFTKDYYAQTDVQMIQDAFTTAGLTEIVTSGISGGRLFSNLAFRGSTLRSMLELISSVTGFVWDVDPFKNLIYEQEGSRQANSNFSDSPDNIVTFPYSNPINEITLGQYNSVEVRGAKRASADVTQTYQSNGSDTFFHMNKDGTVSGSEYRDLTLPPEGAEVITVEVNTGTDVSPVWTAQGVTIDKPDLPLQFVSGISVIWNPELATVEFQTAPPNFANNSFRIIGRYFGPSIGLARDEDAIATFGREFKKTIVDRTVETDDQATDIAEAFLESQGRKDTVVMDVNQDKLMPGELTIFTCTAFGMTDKPLTIRRVSCSLIGAQVLNYRITLGSPGRSFEELLRGIFQNKEPNLPLSTSVTNIKRIKRIAELGSVTVTLRAQGDSGGDYYFSDHTDITDADAEEACVDFATVKTLGTATWPLDYTAPGRTKVTAAQLNGFLMERAVEGSRPTATNLPDGILFNYQGASNNTRLQITQSGSWTSLWVNGDGASVPSARVLGTGSTDAAAGNHTH